MDGLSDGALAFVMAHERAHSFLQHSTQGAANLLLSDELGHLSTRATRKLSHHEAEFDADRNAIQSVVKAGYDPREGLAFLKAIGDRTSFTHPSSRDRFQAAVRVLADQGVELSREDHRFIAQQSKEIRKL